MINASDVVIKKSVYEQRRQNYTEEARPYLDRNFDQKLLNEKYRLSCESELILGHELLQNNFQLKNRKTGEGPDFLVDYKGRNIWIEVVTPQEGSYPRYKNTSGGAGEVDQGNCKLKIASVIKDKKEKFKGWSDKNIVQGDDLKIICVNTNNLALGGANCPFIVSVVYAREEVWWVDTSTYDSGNDFVKQKPIMKLTGSLIAMGLFDQDEFKDIDGVLWFHYSLGTIVPENCEPQFFANQNRKARINELFSCWKRVFYENGILTT